MSTDTWGTLFLFSSLVAAAFAIGAQRLMASRAGRFAALRAVGNALGLEFSPPDLFGNGAGFSGLVGGVPVAAALRGRELFVEITSAIPADLRVLYPPRLYPLDAGVGGQQTLTSRATGDEDFDESIFVDGSAATIATVMDAATRQEIRALASVAGIDAESGRLSLLIRRVEGADVVIRAALSLARRLGAVTVSAHTLADRARSEELPRLRQQALEALLAAFPDADESRSVAASFAGSADERTALLARLMDRTSMAALAAAPRETAAALSGLPPEAACAGLRLLTRSRALAEPLLVEVLHAAARAGTGARALEMEAAAELAESGTAACVAPLKAHLPSRFGDPEVRDAIERALVAVQARLLGEHGDLAIAENGAAGQVSLAAANRGSVSIAKKS